MSDVILSEEQQQAIEKIVTWFSTGPSKEFKLGGYAGTGKTTVIRALLTYLNERKVAVAAFTGKAVNVLQKKGVHRAQTLHRLMYDCEPDEDGTMQFYLKGDLDFDLIIVDEASMISSDLYRDLSSFGIKVLYVGDPGQLEPVGDNPNLMKQCDIVLSKIHRQAELSPIITFANSIRLGAALGLQEQVGLAVKLKNTFRIPDAAQFDQVICAKNKTRLEINAKFRLFQERPTNNLLVGDKLIVLRNNRAFGVFNGMILFVTKIHTEDPQHWLIDAQDEIQREFVKLPIWKSPFEAPLEKDFTIPYLYTNRQRVQMILAEFAYCITCHKSQGSEWDRVLVWDEYMPPQVWDMKRWRYTAITRAAKELVYCI